MILDEISIKDDNWDEMKVDKTINIPNSQLELYESATDLSIEDIKDEVNFTDESSKQFGVKWKTTYYGPETNYFYGRHLFEGKDWTPKMQELKNKVEELTGYRFNSAVVNLYESGKNVISGHRDMEDELIVGTDFPVIASISLGATRDFELIRLTDDIGLNLPSRKYEKGFYIFDFSEQNIAYTFIDNKISPIHVKVNLSDLAELKATAKKIGWSKLAIKIIIDKDIKTNLLDKIIASINFESPFSLVTDYLHKFNIGDNIELTNDLGDLNIKQCIIEYIESLDIDNKEKVINKTVHLYNQFS